MGPNAGLLTGDVDNILWCSSGWKVFPWTGSHCVWCRASEGVLVFLCRGEYDRCGGHANAESDRLRRNSSAGTTRKHVDRASLQGRMRLHRRNPKKLVGFFHECGLQIPDTVPKKVRRGKLSLCVWQRVLPRFGLSTVQKDCLSRVRDPLKGVKKKITTCQRPPGRRPGMFVISKF